LLPYNEDRVILSLFGWIEYQRVSDGRTDGGTELPWLIQRSALQAMRPHCKNAMYRNEKQFYEIKIPYELFRSTNMNDFLHTELFFFPQKLTESSCWSF